LAEFDRAMMLLGEDYRVLEHEWPHKHYEHVEDKLLVFERAGLLFVFNFHPTQSFDGRPVGVPAGAYRVVLDTDSEAFGGFGRVDPKVVHTTSLEDGLLRLYIPSRTGLVLARG
jgi:1,4-alpha-glucan branching enzyme